MLPSTYSGQACSIARALEVVGERWTLLIVRDALYAPAAKERGLFRPEAVDRLLADPNGRLTPLRGNELWQIALLELWLQKHGISGGAG